MVCKAGTILVLHHGIWHCGRQNKTNLKRYMFKVRLNPRVQPDCKLVEHRRLDRRCYNKPTRPHLHRRDQQAWRMCKPCWAACEPWFEDASGRLEIVNRIKMWRYLTDDPTFDVHYWLTRPENQPANRELATA